MEIQEILDQANEHGIMAISAAVEELKQRGQQSEREADAAYRAYFSDVEAREAKVKRRLDDLAQQEAGIKAKISAMQSGLVDATVSGDTDAFNRLQNKLADLEAQRAAVATQMQLLSGAQLPGSLELYKTAEVKCDAWEKTITQWRSELEKIRDFAREQAKAWDRLVDDLHYIPFHTPGLCGRNFTEVATHFRDHRPTGGPS